MEREEEKKQRYKTGGKLSVLPMKFGMEVNSRG